MLCPKCNENLSSCSKTGAHRCPSCKGYWVDPELYITLLKTKGGIANKADRSMRRENRWQAQAKPKRKLQLKCPKDKSTLYVFSCGSIELDYCSTCRGLWFDDQELDKFKANQEKQKSSLPKKDLKKTNSTEGSVGELVEGVFAFLDILEIFN